MSLFIIVALPFLGALLPGLMNSAGRAACAGVTFTVSLAAFVGLLTNLPSCSRRRGRDGAVRLDAASGAELHIDARQLGLFLCLLDPWHRAFDHRLCAPLPQRAATIWASFSPICCCSKARWSGLFLAITSCFCLVFWELTSLSSFLSDRLLEAPARRTPRRAYGSDGHGMGGLAMIGGMLILGQIVGSYDLSVILQNRDLIQATRCICPRCILILLGCFHQVGAIPVPLSGCPTRWRRRRPCRPTCTRPRW